MIPEQSSPKRSTTAIGQESTPIIMMERRETRTATQAGCTAFTMTSPMESTSVFIRASKSPRRTEVTTSVEDLASVL